MLHAEKKKKHGFFLGLAVLAAALAMAGCENLTAGGNTGATGQPGETTGAMGSLTLKIGLDGIISSNMSAQTMWAGAAGVPGVSRTVYPDSIGITGYKLEFEATSGGAAHAPETSTGSTVTIDLIVGSYTITITAFSGGAAIAGGIKSNITVSKDQTTQVSVTLGPKEGAGNGSFVWYLTLPNGVDNPVLYLTTLDNQALTGRTITLTAGQQNQGTLSLASGYSRPALS
jgi:hypothetical protein